MYSVFHVEGGIGKNIIATNVARNIKKKYPDRKLVVVTPWPEVFIHNPYIYRVYKNGMCPYFYEDFIQDKDTLIFKAEPYFTSNVIKRETNLAKVWCETHELELDALKPELYFNAIEQQNAQLLFNGLNTNKPVIVVQNTGGAGFAPNHINFNWYRDIPPKYFQRIINEYQDKFTFIQIKNKNQMALDNTFVVDLSLREVFLLLSKCHGAICMDSMVQHIMAAHKIPALVCWVGTSVTVFGYPTHSNIASNFKFEIGNVESYMDPYPLQTQGHQCPMNYNPESLFNENELLERFKKLYRNYL